MKDGLMLIGELAAFFGVSRKALRLYEKKGIIKPAKTDDRNGYRYYAPEQVRQLNALLELKALGFSLDEIKGIVDGEASKGLLLRALERKRQAWQAAADEARHKAECLEGIMGSLEGSKEAEGIQRMTEEERAWLLAKLVCVEEVRAQRSLSEALWL
mgnify:FL=1|nr:MerR family transcriptional regulator [uncultured Acetatifactor sp.]